jgi:hypothetical protein
METLLGWVEDPDTDLMVKKVSCGILGLVEEEKLRAVARGRLMQAFQRERDIGVAGRVAEALRRLDSFCSETKKH